MLVATRVIKVGGEKLSPGDELPAGLDRNRIRRMLRLRLVQEIEVEDEPEPEPEPEPELEVEEEEIFPCPAEDCEFESTSQGGITRHYNAQHGDSDKEE